MDRRRPAPFSSADALFSNDATRDKLELVLPPYFPENDTHGFSFTSTRGHGNAEHYRKYLKLDLDVSRLNAIHRHLWLAGLPRRARSLHHQSMSGRQIIVTEQADLHMVWKGGRIYLKPLPDYLSHYDTWAEHLTAENALFRDARGFLLSYMWLIRNKSDLRIAQDSGLVDGRIDWKSWTTFSSALFRGLDHATLSDISPRYLYGELRLGRINAIYRCGAMTTSLSKFLRGYHYGYQEYSSFIEQNFAWVLTAIIYITIVLTAMQLGLATTQLQPNAAFNRVSYGVAVFSILGPIAVFFGGALFISGTIVVNAGFAFSNRKKSRRNFPAIFDHARPHSSPTT